MLFTTTPNIEDKRISNYYCLVSGEAILGANAVVAVDLDYETISPSGSGSMLMVTASGTAVKVEG